eukprot:4980591-Pyramimonas_sp.AAC.1
MLSRVVEQIKKSYQTVEKHSAPQRVQGTMVDGRISTRGHAHRFMISYFAQSYKHSRASSRIYL